MTALRLDKLKEELSRDDNVLLAYLFGSAARSEDWGEGDVDIAVLLRDNSWPYVSRLMGGMGLDAGRLDILDLSRADTLMKYKVLCTGIRLVDKGGYEKGLLDEVLEKLYEALDVAGSYLRGSLIPL